MRFVWILGRRYRRYVTAIACFFLAWVIAVTPLSVWSMSAAANEPTAAHQVQQIAQNDGQDGAVLFGAGLFAEAADVWARSAQMFAQQGDRTRQATTLSNLALAYQALGEIDRANNAIAQAFTRLTSETPLPLAKIWNTQGNLYLQQSQAASALEAFEKAAVYYRQANNIAGELRSQINQAQALQSLGYYRRALLLVGDLSPSIHERPNTLVKVAGLRLLGDLQRAVGDLEASAETLEEGLEIAQFLAGEPLADEFSSAPSDNVSKSTAPIVQLFLSLGNTAEAADELEKAMNYFLSAAAIADTTELQVRSQLSQLSLRSAQGDHSQARTLTAQIQASLDRLPVGRTSLNIRLALARQQLGLLVSHDEANPFSEADIVQTVAQHLAVAQRQAAQLEDTRAGSYALGYLGELYAYQQQPAEAKKALRQALALTGNAGANPDLAYQWHWQLGQIEQSEENIGEAIAQYESAVADLQALRGNLIVIAPDLRFDFREQVEPVYRGYVDLLLKSTDHATGDKSANLLKARQTIESLQLAELENYFQEPCVPVTQQLDSVIETAAAPAAVIYPVILPDRTEIVLKLPQQPLKQYTAFVSQPELEALLARLQRNLRLPYTLNAVRTDAAQLHSWLIEPLEADLASSQIDTLVFVLDGFLRSIPMAVLYDGHQYLLEKYSIALAPGLQLVDPRPLERQQLATLIAGLSEPPQSGFSQLPFVIDEVASVQKAAPSRVLLNETFTKTNLETAINNTAYPLVHLATHGQFSADPSETFILAWDKRIQVNELNRMLRQSEQNRQAAIELLILSACETAVGDKRAALGLAGVAVQAGARSTLASLWNLDDQSGALFSDYFYQELANPDISKAQALRNAQISILGDADGSAYQHPLYWAPYVLLGNWL